MKECAIPNLGFDKRLVKGATLDQLQQPRANRAERVLVTRRALSNMANILDVGPICSRRPTPPKKYPFRYLGQTSIAHEYAPRQERTSRAGLGAKQGRITHKPWLRVKGTSACNVSDRERCDGNDNRRYPQTSEKVTSNTTTDDQAAGKVAKKAEVRS
jgi:hypothetical protein